MASRLGMIWADVAGVTQLTLLRSVNSAAPVANALAAKSNAFRQFSWESAETVGAGPPVAAKYESVGDTADLLYACADNTRLRVRLVAPVSSIFLADGETVDPVQIAAITTAVTANLVGASGSLAASFLGGHRQRWNRDYA